jgi:hypothetical protein
MVGRAKPWPEPVTRAFSPRPGKICSRMEGERECEVNANVKDWKRWGSNSDEMYPTDIRRMAKLTPNATSAICPCERPSYLLAATPYLSAHTRLQLDYNTFELVGCGRGFHGCRWRRRGTRANGADLKRLAAQPP